MGQFLRILFVTWLAVALLVFGTMLSGRVDSQPDDFQSLGFDLCEGQPCLMGIVPGLTVLDTARQIVRDHGGTPLSANGLTFTNGAEVFVSGWQSTGKVTDLSVHDSRETTRLTLGQFIQKYGTPCRLSFLTSNSSSQYRAEVSYHFMTLNALLQKDRLDLDSRVYAVFFYSVPEGRSADYCDQNLNALDTVHRFDVGSWSGFTSFTHYSQLNLFH